MDEMVRERRRLQQACFGNFVSLVHNRVTICRGLALAFGSMIPQLPRLVLLATNLCSNSDTLVGIRSRWATTLAVLALSWQSAPDWMPLWSGSTFRETR